MSRINPVRWSTQKIKDLLTQIDQTGSIPRYNPFYNNDSELLAAEINFGYTEAELLDRTRVMDDIFYFALTHANVKTSEDGEVTKIKELRSYQKNLICHFRDHKFNIVLASRQIGKCVHPFTHVTVEMGKTFQTLPIFEVFFRTRSKVSLFDKIIYTLLKTSYRFSV